MESEPLTGLSSVPATSSSSNKATKQTTLCPSDVVCDDGYEIDERARLLIAEGFAPGCAASFAACFSAERIARNVALGRHRRPGVQSPGAYLRGMIQRNDAASALDPRSEAAAVRLCSSPGAANAASEAPRSAPRISTPPDASSRAPALGALAIIADRRVPGETSAEMLHEPDGLSAAERARLIERAREEVRRRHGYLGARALSENGPLMAVATRRALRDLTQAALGALPSGAHA